MGAIPDAMAAGLTEVRSDLWVSPNGGIRRLNDGSWIVKEGRGIDAGAGYGLLIDEVVKNLGNLEAADLDAFSHGKPSLC